MDDPVAATSATDVFQALYSGPTGGDGDGVRGGQRGRIQERARTHGLLGLVPRQHSSGNRNVLLGISKRGHRYLRTPLIHGARSALCRVDRRRDRRSLWASRLKLKRGFKVAAVALANKNARAIWALLTDGENYRPASSGGSGNLAA